MLTRTGWRAAVAPLLLICLLKPRDLRVGPFAKTYGAARSVDERTRRRRHQLVAVAPNARLLIIIFFKVHGSLRRSKFSAFRTAAFQVECCCCFFFVAFGFAEHLLFFFDQPGLLIRLALQTLTENGMQDIGPSQPIAIGTYRRAGSIGAYKSLVHLHDQAKNIRSQSRDGDPEYCISYA